MTSLSHPTRTVTSCLSTHKTCRSCFTPSVVAVLCSSPLPPHRGGCARPSPVRRPWSGTSTPAMCTECSSAPSMQTRCLVLRRLANVGAQSCNAGVSNMNARCEASPTVIGKGARSGGPAIKGFGSAARHVLGHRTVRIECDADAGIAACAAVRSSLIGRNQRDLERQYAGLSCQGVGWDRKSGCTFGDPRSHESTLTKVFDFPAIQPGGNA